MSAAAPPVSQAQVERVVEELLAKGRMREALDEAKAWLKKQPGTRAELLVVHCYRARAREFYLRGQVADAQQIINHVHTHFAKHALLLPSLESLKEAAAPKLCDSPRHGAVPKAPAPPQSPSQPTLAAATPSIKRGPVLAPASSADAERRVEKLIAEGRVRDALEAAKAHLKSHPSESAELLVVRCYQARAGELHQRGQTADAQQIVLHAAARFPQHAHFIGLRLLAVHDLAPTLPAAQAELQALLTEAAAAEANTERQRELAEAVARHLYDPRDLSESTALAPDHPWRKDAQTVWRAFEAVTSRPTSERDLAELDGISRHSPLAAWKLLVRAIQAYLRGRTDSMERNLHAIRGDTPAAALAPVLRALADSSGKTQVSTEVELVLREVSGGMFGMKDALTAAEKALACGKVFEGYTAVTSRLRLLRPHRPDLARELQVGLGRYALQNEDDNQDDTLDGILREQATQLYGSGSQADRAALAQVAALSTEHVLPPKACEMWERFLQHKAVLPPAEQLSPTEKRLVLSRMASLVPKSSAPIRSAIEAMQQTLDEDFDGEFNDEEQLDDALEELGQMDFGKMRAGILRRALQAEATSELYQQLYECLVSGDPGEAEKVAAQWHQAFPRDLAPVLHLMRAAESRDAVQKALGYLAGAEQINALHAEVRATRMRLEYQQTRKHIRNNQLKQAAVDLQGFSQRASGSQLAVVEGLRLTAAYKALTVLAATPGASPIADVQAQLDAALAALRAAHKHPLYGLMVAFSVALDCGVISFQRQETLRRLVDLLDFPEVTDASGVEAVVDCIEVLKTVSVKSFFTPAHKDQCELQVSEGTSVSGALLRRVCQCIDPEFWPHLMYLASGRGLRAESQLTHVFLYYRGVALALAPRNYSHRAHDCFRAAICLAHRCRDTEIADKAAAAWERSQTYSHFVRQFYDPDDLSNAALKRILKRESAPAKRGKLGQLCLPLWKGHVPPQFSKSKKPRS